MTRLTGRLAGVLGLALALAAGAAAWATATERPASTQPSRAGDSVTGVIVQWAPDAGRSDRLSARADAGVDFEQALSHPGLQLLEVEPGQDLDDAIATLRGDDAVLEAEPNWENFTHASPNDPLFGDLWGLRNLGGAIGVGGFLGPVAGADIDATRAWDRTVGSPSTVVAVIDSGYRFNHPDLASVAWTNSDEAVGGGDDDDNDYVDDIRGYDFVGQSSESPAGDNDPTDSDLITGGHGVHVAGTVGAAGNDGVGVTGVGQNLRIMPLRVCANDPSETDPVGSSCPEAAMIDAIDYAGDNGADVANLSLGRTGAFNPLAADALARHPDTLYVISAGNAGKNNDSGLPSPNGHHWPCDYNPVDDSSVPGRIDNVICVAATNQADALAGFSDYGSTSVDLAAPGTQVLSSYPKRNSYVETFAADDFASRWEPTGANGGFSRANESPLTSFGMADTPGAAPAPNTTRQSTSAGFSVPTGVGTCVFTQRRNLSVGAGNEYMYEILLDDVTVFEPFPAPTASGLISTAPIPELNAGGTVKIRQTYAVGASPSSTNGVWLDDFKLRCFEPIASTAGTYDFLQGTSMASPHVAGAAGLLFSLKPTATVTEVRDALLSSVDVLPDLDGLVATDGRLNVAAALDELVPPPPPPPPAQASGSTPAPAVGGGISTARCRVPRLAKLSLSKARALLGVSNCKLGKVTKPKKKKGQKKLPALIVKSSSPKAGAELAAGAKVAVRLGPKPKKRKRR